MPKFIVTCAHRESGAAYEMVVDAASESAAAATASNDGHLVGTVLQAPAADAAAQAIVAEIRGLREDMRVALQTKRMHGGLQYRVMWGMILFVPVGFLLFGGLWFVMQIANEVIANRQ
jgi:hypothetical protein